MMTLGLRRRRRTLFAFAPLAFLCAFCVLLCVFSMLAFFSLSLFLSGFAWQAAKTTANKNFARCWGGIRPTLVPPQIQNPPKPRTTRGKKMENKEKHEGKQQNNKKNFNNCNSNSLNNCNNNSLNNCNNSLNKTQNMQPFINCQGNRMGLMPRLLLSCHPDTQPQQTNPRCAVS